jgi:hypothetical protein
MLLVFASKWWSATTTSCSISTPRIPLETASISWLLHRLVEQGVLSPLSVFPRASGGLGIAPSQSFSKAMAA